jgi:uncharacterized membrane protein
MTDASFTDPTPTQAATPARPPRRWRLDALRGLAIIAMVVFHSAWNLSALGFIATEISEHPGWRLFANGIAASFLLIAGVALALAHGGGVSGAAFWRRVALVAGAAALVTLGTWAAFPERFVTFGILHAIALFSVLALPLLGRPWWAPAMLAALVVAARLWTQSSGAADLQSWFAASPLHPLWQHLGLTWEPPASVDFVPLLPWFAWLLAGVALGALLGGRAAPMDAPLAHSRPLVTLGRWSLPIYLVHQPVLYGGLALLAMAAPQLTIGNAERLDLTFASECVMQCRATASREQCDRGCGCVLRSLRAQPDLHRRVVIESRDDPQTNDAFRAIVDQCRRAP